MTRRSAGGGVGSNQYATKPGGRLTARGDTDLDPETVMAAFDPEGQRWVRCGFTARDMERWQRRNVGLESALIYTWAGIGFDYPHALPDSNAVYEWKVNGFDPADDLIDWRHPTECLQDGAWEPEIELGAALEWRRAGAAAATAAACHKEGMKPAEWVAFREEHPDGSAADAIAWAAKRWPAWDTSGYSIHTRFRDAGCQSEAEVEQWTEVLYGMGSEPRLQSTVRDIENRPDAWVQHADPTVLADVFKVVLGEYNRDETPSRWVPPLTLIRSPAIASHVLRHPTLPAGEAMREWVETWAGVAKREDWFTEGVSPAEAARWEANGVHPAAYTMWQEAGFSPEDVTAWRTAPFEVAATVAARHLGLTPDLWQ